MTEDGRIRTTADWSGLVRPALVGLEPYRPGASVAELKERYGLDELVKLNWNEGLFGPLPGVLEAGAAELANAWMYPEQAYSDLRAALSAWIGIPPERIVPAHGIQSLVATIASVFIRPGDAVIVPRPTYGLYALVSAAAGARVERVACRDFCLDLEPLAEAARRTGARLVWVCDPNNPTGSLVARDEWEAFLGALPDGCVAVADEAYADYVEPELRLRREDDVEAGRPVIVLRTFSKIFGLAGLRLGYAIVHEELEGYLDVVQEPFNVNRVALAAGTASLRAPALIDDRRRLAAEARDLLATRLREAGMDPAPSHAAFVLVDTGVDDIALAELALRRGFLLRPGSEYGLDGYVRITVAPADVIERAARVIAESRAELLAASTPR